MENDLSLTSSEFLMRRASLSPNVSGTDKSLERERGRGEKNAQMQFVRWQTVITLDIGKKKLKCSL